MVIHHDKMAYGKLDSLTKKLSQDELEKMAKLLSKNNDSQKDEKKRQDAACKDKK